MATHDFKINLPDVYRYCYVLFFSLKNKKQSYNGILLKMTLKLV